MELAISLPVNDLCVKSTPLAKYRRGYSNKKMNLLILPFNKGVNLLSRGQPIFYFFRHQKQSFTA